jgi:3-oxoacyl-[acyl-carrier-protein] synthase-3
MTTLRSDGAGRAAYITGMGVFLPNAPVDNDNIERVLGLVNGLPSRLRRRILKNNGILTRHYAIDPASGRRTHTNTALTSEAIRALARNASMRLEAIDCLACGTSTPDQLIPGHALMVQGELAAPIDEVVSTAGVCAAGMTALKYATLSVLSGESQSAVATGSELASNLLRAPHFESQLAALADEIEGNPLIAFEQEFLRWMLSDGAGAALVTPAPRARGLSLRIDWIDFGSCADQVEPCMYWGAFKNQDGSLTGWRDAGSMGEAVGRGFFNLTQDVRLLGREVSDRLVKQIFPRVRARRDLAPGEVDWFLPHYSSEFFRQELHDRFVEIDFPIPFESWFTNLPTKGNTGSASIYIILEEFLRSGRVRAGQRILCFVPESARFTAAYAHFTAVGPDGENA